MKLKLRRNANARAIAALHQRIVLAYHAVDELLNDARFDDYPLCALSVDAVLKMTNSLAEAGQSLEEPLFKLLGNAAPLSHMQYPPEHWLSCVEKFERERQG